MRRRENRALTTTKGGGRDLVERLLDRLLIEIGPLDRDTFFEAAYAHFAEAGCGNFTRDVQEVLEMLMPVLSLPLFLISTAACALFFGTLVSPNIFGTSFFPASLERTCLTLNLSTRVGAERVQFERGLHVGDDPKRDWEGASRAGLAIFRLQRPHNSLRDLLPLVASANELS